MSEQALPLVLAVDDERFNLTLLERILRRAYRVISVTNGQAALDTLVQAPFDLILLDIMMPEMDGLMTLQAIRKNPKTAGIPVILISALSDGASVAHGLDVGANDYITKPIDMDVTLARVQTQIALKKLQDEREQTIKELRAAQDMKDKLLRMASHDLKGPLMNIRMAATLLESAIECAPDGAMLLDSVSSSCDTMQMVIKDFLDTAAMQTGALDLHMQKLELEPLIREVMTENKVNALRKNITVETDGLNGIVEADPQRFRQVVGNLVSNAIKYSPKDTTVSISTEADEKGVTIYIADQGPGIPENERGRLFTQFGKLTPRPTAGESSTGLGLWIVKHLVTLQQGEVGVTCPPDGGSIFWIKMPLVKEKEV